MHGVVPRISIPPLVASGAGLLGYILGYPFVGIVLGVVLGVGLAIVVGRDARTRLHRLVALTRKDPATVGPDDAPAAENDEIDDAIRLVTGRLHDLERAHSGEIAELSREIQLLDRMSDGIMRVDAGGVVTYANVAASALFRGRNLAGLSFIAVTRDHELSDMVYHNLATGEDRQLTFEIPGRDGVYNAVITRLSAAPREALVVLRDITEITRLQTLRRDFVANVSHDLRTPLSAIKIMTETLLDLREDDAESQRFLAKIDDEVNVMTALVNDLLDLASLENPESRLTLREIGIHQAVEDVRARMEPFAVRNNVTLSVDLGEDVDRIEADEQRLTQALVNLVSNAIVHTPAGGLVNLLVRRVGTEIEFIVRDTGRGIHPDDLPRVWERFFRADRSRSGRGTGLGLAIVKHIVLAHGGTIDAASEVGQGSEFRITLPRSQRADRNGFLQAVD